VKLADPTVESGKETLSNFNAKIRKFLHKEGSEWNLVKCVKVRISLISKAFSVLHWLRQAFLPSHVLLSYFTLSPDIMITVKDTLRATVRVSFDGRVSKQFHGPRAQERFDNEVRILRHLEEKACPFVPRLLKTDASTLTMVTTNCGSRVHHLDAKRCAELFAELEDFGVRHEDPDIRNVTYRQQDGRFCLIDFEFAALTEGETNDEQQPATQF